LAKPDKKKMGLKRYKGKKKTVGNNNVRKGVRGCRLRKKKRPWTFSKLNMASGGGKKKPCF